MKTAWISDLQMEWHNRSRIPSALSCRPFASLLLTLTLVSTFSLQPSTFAQGTAFTYQGQLTDGGQPASGIYDLRFTIYDSENLLGDLIAGPLTNSATGVSNGLFTVTLDFGPGVFTGPARFLEVDVRTNGSAAFATLSPRQELTPTPYAILAGDVTPANTNIARLNVLNTATTATGVPVVDNGFIIAANVTSGGSGYTTAPGVTVNDSTGTGASVSSTISNGAVVSLTVHAAGSGYSSNASLTIGPPPSNAYQSFTSTNIFNGVNYLTNASNVISGNGAGLTNLNAWQLNGNAGTAAGLNFVGTTDNQPLEVHVNGQRAFRLEPTPTNGTVNVIGGSVTNGVDPGVVGATIGGGGSLNIGGVIQPNHVRGDYATIAGGSGNTASGVSSAIGGGANNLADDYNATIAGGWLNRAGYHSFVGSGYQNLADGNDSAIGGGDNNNIQTNAYNSFIGGGYLNTVATGADYACVVGGQQNTIGTNAFYATIGGGLGNVAGQIGVTIAGGGYDGVNPTAGNVAIANGATIGGGMGNNIQVEAGDSTIGGGYNNSILSSSPYATIAGGANNVILNANFYSAISGGSQNEVDIGAWGAVIAGGQQNVIQTNADHSAIGGGWFNAIGTNDYEGTIPGGYVNTIQALAAYSTISGGQHNSISTYSPNSTIGGGELNAIQTNNPGSTIGGGEGNIIQSSELVNATAASTIAGGLNNLIQTNGLYSTIGGGWQNSILGGSFGVTIPGGFNNSISGNYATIGGGQNNVIDSFATAATICGGGASGYSNHISSVLGTIGGGSGNTIQAFANDATIAGGRQNEVDFGAWGAVIAGGHGNWIQSTAGSGGNPGNASYSAISGGYTNVIQANANNSVIGGGLANTIQANALGGAIAGGQYNTIGINATSAATIGGGSSNTVSGVFATVPGGFQNSAAGDYSFAAGNRAKANAAGCFVWADSQAADFTGTIANSFLVRCHGGVAFESGGAGTDQNVAWAPGSGAWNFSSDRNLKDRIGPVDSQLVLDKVARLPLSEWSYKGYDQRHIGPMAQDWHDLFPLNDNDKMINELDAQGVALAAIQGLNQKLKETVRTTAAQIAGLNQKLEAKDAQIQALAHRLEAIEKLLRTQTANGAPPPSSVLDHSE